MRPFTASMINSLHGKTGTFCRVFIVNMKSGEVLRFSELSESIKIHNQWYLPAKGLEISNVAFTINSAVSRMSIEVVADADGTTLNLDKLRMGVYNNALFRMYVIDFENPELLDLDEGTENILFAGNFGEISWTDQHRASIEVTGMLSQATGITLERYSPACRTDFGDRRCRVPVYGTDPEAGREYLYGDMIRQKNGDTGTPADYPPFVWMCTNPGVSSSTIPTFPAGPADTVVNWGTCEFTCKANPYLRYGQVGHFTQAPEADRLWIEIVGGNPTDDDHWLNGTIIFYTGELAGKSWEIRKSTTNVIHTFLPFFIKPAEDDWFEIMPGCDHSPGPAGCGRYDNILNYRGEPFMVRNITNLEPQP